MRILPKREGPHTIRHDTNACRVLISNSYRGPLNGAHDRDEIASNIEIARSVCERKKGRAPVRNHFLPLEVNIHHSSRRKLDRARISEISGGNVYKRANVGGGAREKKSLIVCEYTHRCSCLRRCSSIARSYSQKIRSNGRVREKKTTSITERVRGGNYTVDEWKEEERRISRVLFFDLSFFFLFFFFSSRITISRRPPTTTDRSSFAGRERD